MGDYIELKPVDKAMVSSLLEKRAPFTHKGDYGKILMICGSVGYTGAAALSAMGALRTGAGLVYMAVAQQIYAIEAVKLTEPVIIPLPDENGTLSCAAASKILDLIPKMDAVLIGPGLGQSKGTAFVLQEVLRCATCPVVVDADGINLLSAHTDIVRDRCYPTVVTPHDAEFTRLGGVLSHNRAESACILAKELGCVVLLKGHRSVISDGQSFYVNHTGNPGMATGGSGDVLAGVITSLIGQGLSPFSAAAVGAWLHGAAGDICAEQIGQYGMLPQDMINALPRLLR